MQDVLYDILAVGIDPDQDDVPSAEIERFLFEHARTPKASDEFRAFFAQHGLSVRARVQTPDGLVLPDITRASDDAMPTGMPVELMPSPARNPVHLVRDDEVFADDEAEQQTGMHRVDLSLPVARRRRGVTLAICGASLCVAALCGTAAWFGYTTILQLRGEVARASEQSRQDRSAIHALQDHAVDLESSVAATGGAGAAGRPEKRPAVANHAQRRKADPPSRPRPLMCRLLSRSRALCGAISGN